MSLWKAAFAIGVLWHIYAFHRYTPHSAFLDRTQDQQYRWQPRGWAPVFHRRLTSPPAHPLNLIIPDNACTLRITAAAGTELAGAYSLGTFNAARVPQVIPKQKKFTTTRAFVLHAVWLDQGCPHCPIFLTAASRRSSVRVSVPMWGTFLLEPLGIIATVGRHPAV